MARIKYKKKKKTRKYSSWLNPGRLEKTGRKLVEGGQELVVLPAGLVGAGLGARIGLQVGGVYGGAIGAPIGFFFGIGKKGRKKYLYPSFKK